MTSNRRAAAMIRTACALAAAAGVVGCGGSDVARRPGKADEPHLNVGLAAALQDKGSGSLGAIPSVPPQAVKTPDWAKGPSVDVQAILDRKAADAPSTSEQRPLLASNDVGAEPPAPAPPVEDATPPASIEIPAPPPSPPKPFEQRLDEAVLLLSDMVLQQAAEGYSPSLSPWQTYLLLGALEIARPGSFPQVISPRSIGAGAGLSERDYAAAEAVRNFVTKAAALAGEAGPGSLADGIADLAEELESRPMRIQAAELCSRVSGYGRYTTLGTRRFLQGRPIRAIVYVEVARFTNKPVQGASGPLDAAGVGPQGGYAVELSQTLELYHDADGLLTWRRPEATVQETSRNKRRDFYLVHDITLPANLSNGMYRLKVIIRDRTTGQEDQAVIPLEIVSDPALAYQPNPGLSD